MYFDKVESELSKGSKSNKLLDKDTFFENKFKSYLFSKNISSKHTSSNESHVSTVPPSIGEKNQSFINALSIALTPSHKEINENNFNTSNQIEHNTIQNHEETKKTNDDEAKLEEHKEDGEEVLSQRILEKEFCELQERLMKLNFNIKAKNTQEEVTNKTVKSKEDENGNSEKIKNLSSNTKETSQHEGHNTLENNKQDFIYELIKKDLEKIGSGIQLKQKTESTSHLVQVNWDKQKWSLHQIPELKLNQNENSHFKKEGLKNEDALIPHSKSIKEKLAQREFSQSKNFNQESNQDKSKESSNIGFLGKDHISTSRTMSFNKNEAIKNETKQMYDELVQKARVNMKADGSSTASISMRPQGLGRMTLNLSIFNNQVHGQLVVESSEAKSLIENEITILKHELFKQGVDVEFFEIHVREGFELNTSILNQNEEAQESKNNYETNQEFSQKFSEQKNEAENHELKNQYKSNASVLTPTAETEVYEKNQLTKDAFLNNGKIDIHI